MFQFNDEKYILPGGRRIGIGIGIWMGGEKDRDRDR